MNQQRSWFKSSYSCGSLACVEALIHNRLVSVRDSKYLRNPTSDPSLQPVITVTSEEWQLFIDAVATGAPTSGALVASHSEDGTTSLSSKLSDTILSFTPEEWVAFRSGVIDGEFTQQEMLVA